MKRPDALRRLLTLPGTDSEEPPAEESASSSTDASPTESTIEGTLDPAADPPAGPPAESPVELPAESLVEPPIDPRMQSPRPPLDPPDEPRSPGPENMLESLFWPLILLGRWSGSRTKAIARRWLTPGRIAAFCVVLVIGGTLAWTIVNRRHAQLRYDLETGTTEGRAALVSGDFLLAEQKLKIADQAAEGLNLDNSVARSARQLYRESVVWSNLCVRDLPSFLDALEKAPQPLTEQEIIDRFQRDYAGRTLIVSGLVTRTTWQPPKATDAQKPASAPSPEGAVDAGPPDGAPLDGAPLDGALLNEAPSSEPSSETLYASDESVLPVATIDWSVQSPGYRLGLSLQDVPLFIDWSPGDQHQVIMGCEIAALRRSPTESGEWLVELVPSRCTFMTVAEPLEAAGWPTDAMLHEILNRQREATGTHP
jgi:hypothetical protein